MARTLPSRSPHPPAKVEGRGEWTSVGGAAAEGKQAVMVANRRGRLLYLTPAAVPFLERYCPAALENSCQLPREWMEQMEGHLEAGKGGHFAAVRAGMGAAGEAKSWLQVRFRAAGNQAIRLWLDERQGVAGRKGECPRLTRREAEVLQWIVETKSNLEIAMILGISPRTVHKHVEHILRKLGVENRRAAARCHYSL